MGFSGISQGKQAGNAQLHGVKEAEIPDLLDHFYGIIIPQDNILENI